jgi:hypothetical protein
LVIRTAISLHPESAEIISLGFQGLDLCFSKQNCLRNPKIGSKQSIVGATQYYFDFSKELDSSILYSLPILKALQGLFHSFVAGEFTKLLPDKRPHG